MRKYRPNASSYDRVRYGVELVEGLGIFPETTALAAPFKRTNDELNAVRLAREAADLAVAPLRARVRTADYLCDQMLRGLSRAVELAENGRRGPLHAAIFPEGLTPVIERAGARQIEPLRAIGERLRTSRVAGGDKIRADWAPKVAAAEKQLADAVNGRAKALGTHSARRAEERALMDDHELTIEKLMGHVRVAFPGDRARQDAIFPAAPTRSGADEGAETDGDDEPSSPGGGSPGGPPAGNP